VAVIVMEFKGSFQALEALVLEMGTSGHWVNEGVFYKFLTDDGVRINWWPKTHVILFQGVPEKKQKLVELFQSVLNLHPDQIDADLRLVIHSWPDLPDSTKFAILDLIHAGLE
jgi:hypothetical protein